MSRKDLEEENFTLKTRVLELENLLKEQIKISRQNKKLADFDYLTNIPNRMSFSRAIEDMLVDFEKKNYPFTLIYIDIDDFKNINDKYSHSTGDLVLTSFAHNLVVWNRANTVIGRLGGEEFGVLIPGLQDTEAIIIAERIQDNLSHLSFEADSFKVTTSIGVYSPKKGDTIDDIIYKADLAMYHSKESGKNRITLFNNLNPKDLKRKC